MQTRVGATSRHTAGPRPLVYAPPLSPPGTVTSGPAVAFPHAQPVVPLPVSAQEELAPSHSCPLAVTDGEATSNWYGLCPEMGAPRRDSSLHKALGPMNVNDTEGHRLEAHGHCEPKTWREVTKVRTGGQRP